MEKTFSTQKKKKEIRERNLIQFSLQNKKNITKEYWEIYLTIYVYCCCLKKAVITKDIKAECKSNLFKNKRDWKGGI